MRVIHCSPALDAGDESLRPDDLADVDDDLVTAEVLPVDVTKADRVQEEEIEMGAFEHCLGDLNGDGEVNGDDLGSMLGDWGSCPGCATDFNCDNTVDGDDLGTLHGAWGCCPGIDCVVDEMPELLMSGPANEDWSEWLSGLDFNSLCGLLEGFFGE